MRSPVATPKEPEDSHHDDLYGDGDGELGFVNVVDLLEDKHHGHDDEGGDQVAEVGFLDLHKDVLQGLWDTGDVFQLALGTLLLSRGLF